MMTQPWCIFNFNLSLACSPRIKIIQRFHLNLSFHFIPGSVYNLGEAKKNPDKLRQKYLTAFFGPTAIGTSGIRAIRNTMMPLFWHSWMNIVFNTRDFSKLMRTLTVKKFADQVLSKPFIQIRCFRAFNTLYFTSIGWAIFYIVWKWSTNAPIIAGRKKRASKELQASEVEDLIEKAFLKITSQLDRVSAVETKMKPKSLTTEE